MSSAIAPRFEAALAALDLQTDHRILEVGCGHGVLVSLLCERLTGCGVVQAIDRSRKMVETAERRNADFVRAGIASFQTTDVQAAGFHASSFDRIVAVRVRDLWADSDAVLPALRSWLRPAGMVCAVLDAPNGRASADAAEAAVAAMRAHGFRRASRRRAAHSSVQVVIGEM